MKINLHCHTNYSDGDDIFEMAKEHQRQGFSAFVVTDHVYPLHIAKDVKNGNSRSISSYAKFQHQNKRLKEIEQHLNYPCIQGMELALYGEEILIFGEDATKEIFNFLEHIDLAEQEKYVHTEAYREKIISRILNILQKNKEKTAIILCHPQLLDESLLNKLSPIIDGYEFQNSGCYYFTDETNADKKHRIDMDIPAQLKSKNKFYNSDAHYIGTISCSEGNFHNSKIENLDDLISYIKTPANQNINIMQFKQNRERK